MQVLVSIAGIALMTSLAYYRSWSKRLDEPAAKITPAAASNIASA